MATEVITDIFLISGKVLSTDTLEQTETGYVFTQDNTEYEIPWTSVLYIRRLKK